MSSDEHLGGSLEFLYIECIAPEITSITYKHLFEWIEKKNETKFS